MASFAETMAFLPRLSALVTDSEVTAQSLPCAVFLYRLFQTTKIFYSPDDAIATAAARFGEETQAEVGVVFNVKWRRYIYIYIYI